MSLCMSSRQLREGAGHRWVCVPLRIETLGPERDVAVGAERAAGTGEMGVGEEVAEPGVGELLLDAPAPLLGRAIRALRQPAALRRDPEQTTVLVLAHRQLQPDALVAGEERQVPVRGRGPDDLEATLLLETAEGGYQVLVDLPEQRLQTREPRPPEIHQRQQRLVARGRQRRRCLVAGGEALREERFHLACEGGADQLIRQHRSEADRQRRRRSLGGQLLQPLQQREIRVQRRLAQPVAAVRPATVIQDVRKMTVEREDELHRVPGQLERAADRTASARAYNARYRSAERSQLKSRVIAARTILRHAGRSP